MVRKCLTSDCNFQLWRYVPCACVPTYYVCVIFCFVFQVSLRPAMKSMKLGSSAGRTKPAASISAPDHTHPDNVQGEGQPPRRGQSAESIQKSVIPRTRDDSSDEDEQQLPKRPGGPLLEATPSLMGHAPPIPGYPYPGNYPLPPQPLLPHQQAPPPHHMMPPPLKGGGGPELYYSHAGGGGGRGLVPTPPYSAGGPGILPHHMPPPMVSTL